MWKHLTLQDRQTIEIQLMRWSTQKEIATVLKRDPSVISREIKNHSVKKRWRWVLEYLALEADHKAYVKRWWAKTHSMKINMNTRLKLFIISELETIDKITSPKSIAFEWNNKPDEDVTITHESIYKWLERPENDKYRKHLLYKKWYKKTPRVKWSKIIWRVWLDKRSDKANNRTENGHFEADLVVSGKWSKAAILTLVDRTSRLPRIHLLKDKSSETIMNIITLERKILWIKSVTFDNGMEFAYHHMLHKTWIDTFFCEPYHSREKWSIENLNRIIRRWFPKGTDFAQYTQEDIEKVCKIIADSPREILDFRSSNDVHFPLIC